jgi:hypothetical protein
VLERLCNITGPNEHRSIWLALAEQIFAARQRFNVGAVFLECRFEAQPAIIRKMIVQRFALNQATHAGFSVVAPEDDAVIHGFMVGIENEHALVGHAERVGNGQHRGKMKVLIGLPETRDRGCAHLRKRC